MKLINQKFVHIFEGGDKLLDFFTKKYLGIEISDSHIRSINTNGKITVEESLAEFCMQHSIDYDNSISVWADLNIVLKTVSYCISREPRTLMGLNIILAVPSEFYQQSREVLIREIMETKNVRSLILVDNIIAAAVGASSEDARIMGPKEVSKKLYIFSQSTQSYISLIWAGGLVEFTKINKGYDDLDKDDLSNAVENLIRSLPTNVPGKFLQLSGMKPFLHEWNKDVDRVFVSIPTMRQYSLGQEISDYNVIYTKYSDHLVLEGLMSIVKHTK